MNLSLRIRRDYASYPVEIKSVHTDDTIEPVVVFASNLSSCLALVECYAVLPQAASCRRIYGIADFFRGRGGAFDVIFALKPVGVQKRFENKLRHRRAADIAVAYKQYSNHNCAKIGKIVVCRNDHTLHRSLGILNSLKVIFKKMIFL